LRIYIDTNNVTVDDDVAMSEGQLSLDELADRVGLSRRAIRFYVQRGLLPPPLGLGRGRHYDQRHLETLRRIQELQSAGHSLDAIGQILAGGEVTPPAGAAVETGLPGATRTTTTPRPPRRRSELSAELWTRLRLAPGVELHVDAAAHPTAEQLLKIRQAVRRILRPDLLDDDDEETDDAED
jgi:DNA-binding transcriptional MerR regulator